MGPIIGPLADMIAINLTIQTVKDVGIFPTAFAQSEIQKVMICNGLMGAAASPIPAYGDECAQVTLENELVTRQAPQPTEVQKVEICRRVADSFPVAFHCVGVSGNRLQVEQ